MGGLAIFKDIIIILLDNIGYYNESLEAERCCASHYWVDEIFQPAGHLEAKPLEFTPLVLPTRWELRGLPDRVLGEECILI